MLTALGCREESPIEHTCVGRISRSRSCCSGLELQERWFGMVYYWPLGCGRELTLGTTDLFYEMPCGDSTVSELANHTLDKPEAEGG